MERPGRKKAGLPVAQAGVAAATLGDYAYALGGGSEALGSYSTNVYRYNGTAWQLVGATPTELTDTTAETLDNQIFVVGGRAPDVHAFTNVYSFDGTDWQSIAGLPEARGGSRAVTWNDSLYVLGGWGAETNLTLHSNVYRLSRGPNNGVAPAMGTTAGGGHGCDYGYKPLQWHPFGCHQCNVCRLCRLLH